MSSSRAVIRTFPATALLWVACVVTLMPLAWMALASLKTNQDVGGSLFLPLDEGGNVAPGRLTFEHYKKLFGELGFLRPVVNSVFLSSVTGLLATFCCAMGGYALARFEFRGRGAVTAIVLAAVLVPQSLLMAPSYELLHHLSLLDTFTGLILPAMAPAFGVFLFRQATLTSVPVELLESARIDGCGELRLFVTMVLPLVKPMIATFLMITFLGVWNNFIGPQVVLQSEHNFPLPVAVAQLRGTYYQDYGLQMAGTMVSVVPVFVLFLVLQRGYVSGLTAGAVKG